MALDNKTAPRAQPERSVFGAGRLAVAGEIRLRRRNCRRGNDAAIAHAIDELRHVVVERRVLLVQRNAPLQKANAGGEIVANESFEPALESLERRALVELFEWRPDGEGIVGLRHREVEQAELQTREVKFGIDVERGAHLRHGFRVFAPLRELGAQEITQLCVTRVSHDGGSQSLQLWRFHGVRPHETGR